MPTELYLTPLGHLHARADGAPDSAAAVVGAWADGEAAGLLALAASRESGGSAPVTAFWREFAARYLAQRCHTPATDAGLEPVAALADADAGTLTLELPPMRGAEYATPALFQRLWAALDEWVRAQAQTAGGLAEFLARHAPLWKQVGRVCFHLAENRRDAEFPFAFLATYAPRVNEQARLQYRPLGEALREYAGASNRQALVQLLTPVQQAAEKSALIRDLVESGDLYHPLAWTPAEALAFLREAPLYEACGILVRLPDWWQRRVRPQVAVTLGAAPQARLGADALLDFKLGWTLDGEELSAADLEILRRADSGLVLLRGRWVEVDRAKLDEALHHWQTVAASAADGIGFLEGMRLLAGAAAGLAGTAASEAVHDWSAVHAGDWLRSVLERLRDPRRLAGQDFGQGLRATLRPYQLTGAQWLWFLSRLGLGACLADDMGLGKTLQVLAVLRQLKTAGAGASLLVLPASLLGNWRSELERFAPDLTPCFVHPALQDRAALARLAADPAAGLRGVDLVLTTYGQVARLPWLSQRRWELVILDEAQAIKNPGARQTRAVKALTGAARVALTGTPVENRLGDLWSLFDFLCPGLLGTASRFKAFTKALDEKQPDRYAPLRNLVRPYILRRLKTDRNVIADLPAKTEVIAWCGLAKVQAALYQRAVEELTTALAGAAAGIRRRGLVLAFLMRFKQICNHPSHALGDGRYTPADSGKFTRLAELCEEIGERQERALVFTQFRELTEPLAGFLATQFGRPGLVLHGGTPVAARRGLVEAFQAEDGPPFFVLSLKAGGTGLNLTAATQVIHFDRWWNPAVENQATDRAYRIGQQHPVMVHKFACQGTIEEKIDRLIAEKQSLARDVLGEGADTLLTEMSNDELLALVSLDLDKATL